MMEERRCGMAVFQEVRAMTTMTDPWSDASYVPVARRKPPPAPIASAHRDAGHCEAQRPVHPVVVARPVPTAVLAERERRRQRRVGAWRAWGSAALLLLGFGAALIAYDRALVPIFRDVEAAASQAVVGSTICAVAQDSNAATAAAMEERDRRLQEAGVLEEGEALSVLDTAAADAFCGG
jgi:hypothetical protein